MNRELKGCPFCGGPGHLERFDDPPKGRGYHVVCHGDKYCPMYCSEPYSDLLNRKEAIGRWNTRSAQPIGEEMVERVARAIFDDDEQWDRFPRDYREPWLRKAERTINAISQGR